MYLVPYPTAAGVGAIPQIKSIYNYKDYNSLMYVKVKFLLQNGLWKIFF